MIVVERLLLLLISLILEAWVSYFEQVFGCHLAKPKEIKRSQRVINFEIIDVVRHVSKLRFHANVFSREDDSIVDVQVGISLCVIIDLIRGDKLLV